MIYFWEKFEKMLDELDKLTQQETRKLRFDFVDKDRGWFKLELARPLKPLYEKIKDTPWRKVFYHCFEILQDRKDELGNPEGCLFVSKGNMEPFQRLCNEMFQTELGKIKFLFSFLAHIKDNPRDPLSIIGANGSGKTKFATDLTKLVQKDPNVEIYILPAERKVKFNNLSYDKTKDSTKDAPVSEAINHLKRGDEWQDGCLVFYQKNCEQKKYDKIHERWSTVLGDPPRAIVVEKVLYPVTKSGLHNKICSEGLEIFVQKEGTKYPITSASSGERNILYCLIFALAMPEKSLIFVDEPEKYLETNTAIRLWNKIEESRPDCTFIYLTHDIDFMLSKTLIKDSGSKNIKATLS